MTVRLFVEESVGDWRLYAEGTPEEVGDALRRWLDSRIILGAVARGWYTTDSAGRVLAEGGSR